MVMAFISTESLAAEGFHSLQNFSRTSSRSAFMPFPQGHDCGSVRIHSSEQFYLTALHCIRSARSPDQYVSIGNLLNPESLNIYNKFDGEFVQIGTMRIKILAHGNCWTGFGIDVVSSIVSSDQEKAINCLRGDWLIFELISGGDRSASCIKTELDYSDNVSIAALGGSRVEVKRNTGLTRLDGRIYSLGNIFSLNNLLNDPRYPSSMAITWGKFKTVFSALNRDFLISDADIINGMSGGPIIVEDRLIGVSTVGLLPNYIFEYPELTPMLDGYNFGIHGGISLRQIVSSETEDFFHCL
jgi:hypothetical protein